MEGNGAEDDQANAHFQDLGGHAVWCPRGPNQYLAVGDREAVSSRLACNVFGCYLLWPPFTTGSRIGTCGTAWPVRGRGGKRTSTTPSSVRARSSLTMTSSML